MSNKQKLESFVNDIESNNNFENIFDISIVETKNELVLDLNIIVLKQINYSGISDYDYKIIYDKLIENIIRSFKKTNRNGK